MGVTARHSWHLWSCILLRSNGIPVQLVFCLRQYPFPDHIRWDLFCDKWHMFCLSLLGPEFIFMLALGQYVSARASVQAFHTLDHKDWTLKHAFYADMGASSSNPMDGSHSQSMLHSYIIWWKRNTLTIRRSQRAKLMTKTSPTALQGR